MKFVIRILPFLNLLWERILKRAGSPQLLGGVRKKLLHILALECFQEGCSGEKCGQRPAQAEWSSAGIPRHFLLLGEVLFSKYDVRAIHGY